MTLQDELERIARRAPDVVVPADTWARARRSRRRAQVGLVGVVVALLALVTSPAWLPHRLGVDAADSPGSTGTGVPSRIYVVPEALTKKDDQEEWAHDLVTSDVTVVGVGAAAWTVGTGLQVVVDATRGDYHLLDLPDFLGNHTSSVAGHDPALALSPDGTSLAYAYAVIGPDAQTAPIPSGVRIVDLTTGEQEEFPVAGEEGTAITRIVWSPDASWIAFAGQQQSYWTADRMGTSAYLDRAGPVLGRVALGSGELDLRKATNDELGLAVDADGTVTFDAGGLRRWDGRTTVDVGGGRRELALELGRLRDKSLVRLAGNDLYAARAVELVAPDGATRVVVDLPTDVGISLSLAVDLMSPDRPTVERPEPDWPLSSAWWTFIPLAVVGAAVLIGLGLVLTRPRRRGL
ncbi:MAG: hypothetical protein JWM84_3285 [Nocardioides sp.]|nr:hypothetical protein [Nocardioides sp.]